MDNHDFEVIYQQYVSRVFRFLLKLSGDYHLAEEMTQETFLKAYINLSHFRGESSLFVWLCQIGKNLYYNLLRSNSKKILIDETESLRSDFDLEKRVIIKEEIQRTLEILSHIPEPYQTVFFQRIYLELNYKEIGKNFQKTENWARVTFYRAKNMLREKIKEAESNEM